MQNLEMCTHGGEGADIALLPLREREPPPHSSAHGSVRRGGEKSLVFRYSYGAARSSASRQVLNVASICPSAPRTTLMLPSLPKTNCVRVPDASMFNARR